MDQKTFDIRLAQWEQIVLVIMWPGHIKRGFLYLRCVQRLGSDRKS